MTQGTASKARVLLVDDSKVMRQAAKKMLGGEFDVVTAEDGEDAWQQLQDDPTVLVVFTDLSMPRLDGYGLLQRIRAAEDGGIQNLPVIVVTGAENDDRAREQALEAGATDFITKPFNSTDLLARARAHAGYRRTTQQLEQQITIDPITGLANKAGFLDRLEQDLSYARRHRRAFTVVRVEIDEFKQLFLRYRKELADKLLIHVANVLRSRIRKEDTAARVGMAGFAISLAGCPNDGCTALAERIRAEVAGRALRVGGKPLRLTVSAGVWTPDFQADLTAKAVLEGAQRVLETALSGGGNRVASESAAGGSQVGSHGPTRAGEAASIDALLRQLERGERAAVAAQLPQALDRLLPLLQLLSGPQRARVVHLLQSMQTELTP